MKMLLLAAAAAIALASPPASAAITLDCDAPVIKVGSTDPGPDPVTRLSVSYNAGDWRVVYTRASGATINRADQYAMTNSSDATRTQWAGALNNRPKLYMNGTIFTGGSKGYTYHEVLFDFAKPGPIKNQVAMEAWAQCQLSSEAAPAPTAHTPRQEQMTPEQFDETFKQSIAQGKAQGAPITRFSEETEVGWEQVIMADDMAVKLTVLISPPTTFAIKHLCVGDRTRQPLQMNCVSNLGQSWMETKNADGTWAQSDFVNLPWHRDLAALSFE